jgi:hypothetical protein
MLLRCPKTDIDDQAAPGLGHHPGRMRAGDPCRAHACIHHARPSMCGLLPKRRSPGEFTVFHHALVAAPGGVDQNIERSGFGCDPGESCGGFVIVEMVAADSLNRCGKIGRLSRAAGGEHLESGFRQGNRDAFADASTRSGHKGSGHLAHVGKSLWTS